MSDARAEFAQHYAAGLNDYLAQAGEAGLERAYELGRQAVESGFGVLDVAAIYRDALTSALRRLAAPEESMRCVAMAEEFWAESLAPFEMTHRGFREANEELQRFNKVLENEIVERKRAEAELQKAHDELELRVQQRTAELARANAELQAEISERERYVEELRLRERAIEASSAGIIISDARKANYPITYANPAFAQMTGYSREELIGRNPRFLQGTETDPEAIERIAKALREERSCLITLKNYRKDGSTFWNELFLSPVRDSRGALTHYIGVLTDVTQLLLAEEARHEMELAKQIQLSLLPAVPLQCDGAHIAGYCLPATHVGGDYFDYFVSGPDTTDIVIADVSGHSVGAALIMAEARSTLKTETLRRLHAQGGRWNLMDGAGAGDILRDLNVLLYDDLSRSDLFITMFYMRYNQMTRRLSYANAGHTCPLLLRAGETACRELNADGLILGVNREVAFEEKSIELHKGDSVLLYTDGITEAQNPEGMFFGIERLAQIFASQEGETPGEIIDKIVEALEGFCRSRPFADDVSMVILKAS